MILLVVLFICDVISCYCLALLLYTGGSSHTIMFYGGMCVHGDSYREKIYRRL